MWFDFLTIKYVKVLILKVEFRTELAFYFILINFRRSNRTDVNFYPFW